MGPEVEGSKFCGVGSQCSCVDAQRCVLKIPGRAGQMGAQAGEAGRLKRWHLVVVCLKDGSVELGELGLVQLELRLCELAL